MASTYLSRTPASSGSSSVLTYSFWTKRSGLGVLSPFLSGGNSGTVGQIVFSVSDQLNIYNGASVIATTNAKFRDTSAWYHIVISLNSSETGTDKCKIWINGVQETSFATDNRSTFTTISQVNQSGIVQYVGSDTVGYVNGLMSHIHMVDGTAYDASAFGETDATTGIWKPKTAPSVTYGTNGFFLKFENSGSMGTDSSPNGNNFTVNGTMTQTVDTPSNVFSTLNAVNTGPYFAGTLSNGNLSYTNITAGNYYTPGSTLRVSLGKWYSEFKVQSATDWIAVGVDTRILTATNDHCGKTASGWLYVGGSSAGGSNSLYSASFTSYGDSYTTNDIIGVALDLDNKKLYFSKNGTWQNSGDPESGATGTGAIDISTIGNDVYFGVGNFSGINTAGWHCNFGNGYFGTTPVASAGSNGNGAIFEFDCPNGYYALNTKNINTYG